MHAVKMVENAVAWIPYGWVTILVNSLGQDAFPKLLVIPYLNAKLALNYPSISMLVNFNFDHMKANQLEGNKYWMDNGDSYAEWLSGLSHQEDSQVRLAIQIPPGQPRALMDGSAEDGTQDNRPDASMAAEDEEGK